jgi:uncharacterized LabA/DUF88 family protein
MNKIAILVDVGFVKKAFSSSYPSRNFSPDSIYDFTRAFVKTDEELVRIYFYHAEPFDGIVKLPVSRSDFDFKTTPEYSKKKDFLKKLSLKDYVAIRRGKTIFTKWELNNEIIDKFRTDPTYVVTDDDYTANIQQKGVDIKIGLDVAWISEHNEIGKLILVTADSDFVPAMKFARREGVQIVVGQYKPYTAFLSHDFREHTDVIRNVDKTSSGWQLC